MSNILPADVWPHIYARRSIFQYVPYHWIGRFTALSDFVLIVTASLLAGFLYNALVLHSLGNPGAYLAVGCYSGLIFLLLARLLGIYQPNALLSVSAQIRGVLLAWAAVLLFVTSMFFLLKTGANYSRGANLSFSIVGLGFVLASRAITGSNLHRALANGTLAGRRVIVIGDAEELKALSALELLRTYGTREVGRFELSASSFSPMPTSAEDLAVVDAGINAAQSKRAEQVLLAMRWVDTSRRDSIRERLRVLPLPVMLLPDRSVSSVLADTGNSNFASPAIEVQRAPLSTQNLAREKNI